MHEKDARLASGRWAVVHGNVAPGADLDGLDEEAGFQGGGDGGGHGLLRRSARFVNVEESQKHNNSSFRTGEARRSHFSLTLHCEIEFGQRTSQDRQWLPSVKLATAAT